MVLQAIKYKRGQLEILDQLKLPYEEVLLDISNPEQAWSAIKRMQVRGAPAIAIVAALSTAVWCTSYALDQENQINLGHNTNMNELIRHHLRYLVTSRPTAVNLTDAAQKLEKIVSAAAARPEATGSSILNAYVEAAEQMLIDDVQDNQSIGEFGAKWLLENSEAANAGRNVSVLTHCNTGYAIISCLSFSRIGYYLCSSRPSQVESTEPLFLSYYLFPSSRLLFRNIKAFSPLKTFCGFFAICLTKLS